MNEQFEIKLSFLQNVDKYSIFVLHLTSYLIDEGIRKKFVSDAKTLDSGHRQVIGIYAIPKKTMRIKSIINITKIGETDLQKVYQKLEGIPNIIDIEGNDEKLYTQFKNDFYLHAIDTFEHKR